MCLSYRAPSEDLVLGSWTPAWRVVLEGEGHPLAGPFMPIDESEQRWTEVDGDFLLAKLDPDYRDDFHGFCCFLFDRREDAEIYLRSIGLMFPGLPAWLVPIEIRGRVKMAESIVRTKMFCASRSRVPVRLAQSIRVAR